MSFRWSVQPYRYMNELVANYAETTMLATRKKAVQYAAEGEKWMKENAPWKDRTEEERYLAMRGVISKLTGEWLRRPTLTKSNIPARQGLHAKVLVDDIDSGYQNEIARLKEEQKNGKKIIEEIRKENAKRWREFRRNVLSEHYLFPEEESQRMISPRTGDFMINPKTKKYVTKGSHAKAMIEKKLSSYSGDVPVPDKIDHRERIAELQKEYRSQKLPFVSIKFAYSEHTPYGIWLEIANNGKYSIISKTVDKYSQKFFNEVRSIANLKQYRDRIAFGEEVSPEQNFQQFAASETVRKGKEYKPWTSEMTKERERRRPEYQRSVQKYYAESLVEQGKRKNAIRANSVPQARRMVAKYSKEGGLTRERLNRLDERNKILKGNRR